MIIKKDVIGEGAMRQSASASISFETIDFIRHGDARLAHATFTIDHNDKLAFTVTVGRET